MKDLSEIQFFHHDFFITILRQFSQIRTRLREGVVTKICHVKRSAQWQLWVNAGAIVTRVTRGVYIYTFISEIRDHNTWFLVPTREYLMTVVFD